VALGAMNTSIWGGRKEEGELVSLCGGGRGNRFHPSGGTMKNWLNFSNNYLANSYQGGKASSQTKAGADKKKGKEEGTNDAVNSDHSLDTTLSI